MIVAIGTDLVEVQRIQRLVEDPRLGVRFRQRVFTENETAYCDLRSHAAESFGARFAAKEAVMKVLGRGFGDGVGWREIEVERTGEHPRVVLHGRAKLRSAELGIVRWHLSLSHTSGMALAFVVAEASDD